LARKICSIGNPNIRGTRICVCIHPHAQKICATTSVAIFCVLTLLFFSLTINSSWTLVEHHHHHHFFKDPLCCKILYIRPEQAVEELTKASRSLYPTYSSGSCLGRWCRSQALLKSLVTMSTTAVNKKRKIQSTVSTTAFNKKRKVLSTAKKLPTKRSKQSDVASESSAARKLAPLPANFSPRFSLGLFYSSSWKREDDPNLFDIYTEMFVRQIAEFREGDDSVMEYDMASFSLLYQDFPWYNFVLQQALEKAHASPNPNPDKSMWHLKVVLGNQV
jgi:hypothetical protein